MFPIKLSKCDIEKLEEVLSQRTVLRHLDKTSGKIYSINTKNVLWFEFTALESIE